MKRKFVGLPRLSSNKYNLYLSPQNVSGVKQNLKIDNRLIKEMPKKAIEYLYKNQNKLNDLMNALPNMCEGKHTTLDVAEFVGLPFRLVNNYVDMWVEKNLLKKIWTHPFKKSEQKNI